MGLNAWMNSKANELHWSDISLVKISVAGFVLMMAKLWQPLLSLDWQWYGIIFVLAAAKPTYKVFGR
jgi:hypothetical protein